jgi:hypothetical protein
LRLPFSELVWRLVVRAAWPAAAMCAAVAGPAGGAEGAQADRDVDEEDRRRDHQGELVAGQERLWRQGAAR